MFGSGTGMEKGKVCGLMFDYRRCVDTESKHAGNKPQNPDHK